MADINDASNLTYMSDLLNLDTINKNLDIEAIERDMIGSAGVQVTAVSDPASEFRAAMQELAQDVGINLDDEMGEEFAAVGGGDMYAHSQNAGPVPEYEDDDEYYDDDEEEGEYEEYGPGGIEEELMGEDEEDFEEDFEDDNEFLANLKQTGGGPSASNRLVPPGRRGVGKEPANLRYGAATTAGYRPAQTQYYQPQQYSYQNHQQQNQNYNPNRYHVDQYSQYDANKQQHLTSVMQSYGGQGQMDTFSIEREQEEDTKSIMLEDIDELKYELEDDGVTIDRIPEVDQDSPFKVVQKVHKMLRMKYIRRRYNHFGHELILAGAYGLGYIFDGKRKIGPYQPDLSGWHNEVRTKLRRMRYETASIVSDVVREYNIGPLARLLLELGPSAVIYSNMRRAQHGQNNYTVDQMSDAINELRDLDD